MEICRPSMTFRRIRASYGALVLSAAVVGQAQDNDGVDCDAFCYLAEANKASLVMLAETGLVSPPLAGRIARAVVLVIDEQSVEGARRSGNYLHFENRLEEIGGDATSKIHIGRSRQDLHGTVRRMQLRGALLTSLDALLDARDALLDLASRNADALIPAYTHGVQAHPTSLGHYLLAFSAASERDADRLMEAWQRTNRSPLGAGPLGTSGFPIDRARLAELLGFLGPIENSFDANFLASMDAKVEFANAVALSALHVGQFVENIHTQYHDPQPWFVLGDGETSISTSMPQKANPRPLDRIRTDATEVLAGAHLVALNAHNTNTGMHDYRPVGPLLDMVENVRSMYEQYARVVRGLRIDRARAIAEINADYSTMTEVADTLVREADVPFRVGHRYATALTRHGRDADKRPADLSDEVLERIYADVAQTPLPISVDVLRKAMDPVQMVANRRGLGGSQPESVRAMLAAHRTSLAESRQWLRATRDRLATARKALQAAFLALM